MPKDTRKLAEETIAGRSSSTTENISTRHHPSLAHDVGGPYLPGHFTGPSWLQVCMECLLTMRLSSMHTPEMIKLTLRAREGLTLLSKVLCTCGVNDSILTHYLYMLFLVFTISAPKRESGNG